MSAIGRRGLISGDSSILEPIRTTIAKNSPPIYIINNLLRKKYFMMLDFPRQPL
jgi:hypothetical protein